MDNIAGLGGAREEGLTGDHGGERGLYELGKMTGSARLRLWWSRSSAPPEREVPDLPVSERRAFRLRRRGEEG